MEWLVFGKREFDPKSIEEFENICGYQYPASFKKIAIEFDGGTPECMVFDTKETEGRVFNYLLSFDKDEDESIWDYVDQKGGKVNEWDIEGLKWQYVPFADDPFGNLICFDRTNDHVVFWNHEIRRVEEVADTFEEFVNSLRGFDDDLEFKKLI